MWSSSRIVYDGLTGTTTTPARRAPTTVAAEASDDLMDHTMRSPARTPARARAPATSRVVSSNCPAEIHVDGPLLSRRSGAFGSEPQRQAQAAGRLV